MSTLHKKEIKPSFFVPWDEYSEWQLFCLVIGFFIFLYLRLILRTNDYVGDETVTVNAFQHDLYTYLTQALPRSEYHFPGTFLLLYAIGHWIGVTNSYLLSLPYLIMSILSYLMLAKINWWQILGMKKGGNEILWVNVITCMMVAYNVHHQIYSLELRPYSTLTLLSLLALWLSFLIFNSSRLRWMNVFALAAIISFHNFGLIVLIPGASYFFLIQVFHLMKKKESFNIFAKKMLPVFQVFAVSFIMTLPLVWLYCHSAPMFVNSHTNAALQFHRGTHTYIKEGWQGIKQVISIEYGLVDHLKIIRFVLAFFFIVGTFIFILKNQWRPVLFLLCFVVLPIYLIYGLAVHSDYWFLQRQFIWTAPFWAVYHGACVIACIRFTTQNWIKD